MRGSPCIELEGGDLGGPGCALAIRAFHPILYVADPYAERDFFARFGFDTVYEGDEFPDFLAVQCGSVIFGISGNKEDLPLTAHEGVRWQFRVDDVDELVAVCESVGLANEVIVETCGETQLARIVKVTRQWRFGLVRRAERDRGVAQTFCVPA